MVIKWLALYFKGMMDIDFNLLNTLQYISRTLTNNGRDICNGSSK